MARCREVYNVATIREILAATGMTQKALSQRFGIPLRTVENWATGKRECPVYIRKMIVEILIVSQ